MLMVCVCVSASGSVEEGCSPRSKRENVWVFSKLLKTTEGHLHTSVYIYFHHHTLNIMSILYRNNGMLFFEATLQKKKGETRKRN